MRPEKENLTLHGAADAWLLDREAPLRGLGAQTLSGYRTFVNQLKAIVPPEVPAAAIRPVDCRHIIEQFQEEFGLSANTAKKRHNSLRMLFNWMMEEELVVKNPVKLKDAPKARVKHVGALREDGYRDLIAAILGERDASGASDKERRNAQSLLDLMEVLWRSGIRSKEAHRLRWEDIDLKARVWLVRAGGENKGGERRIPFNMHFLPILQRRRLLGGAGPFLPEGHHRYLWKKFKERHPEFKGDTSLHKMRSRVVTRFAELGLSEAKFDAAGHTTEDVNEGYKDLEMEFLRKAIDQL